MPIGDFPRTRASRRRLSIPHRGAFRGKLLLNCWQIIYLHPPAAKLTVTRKVNQKASFCASGLRRRKNLKQKCSHGKSIFNSLHRWSWVKFMALCWLMNLFFLSSNCEVTSLSLVVTDLQGDLLMAVC